MDRAQMLVRRRRCLLQHLAGAPEHTKTTCSTPKCPGTVKDTYNTPYKLMEWLYVSHLCDICNQTFCEDCMRVCYTCHAHHSQAIQCCESCAVGTLALTNAPCIVRHTWPQCKSCTDAKSACGECDAAPRASVVGQKRAKDHADAKDSDATVCSSPAKKHKGQHGAASSTHEPAATTTATAETIKTTACPDCAGSGKVQSVNPYTGTIRCDECGGTGSLGRRDAAARKK